MPVSKKLSSCVRVLVLGALPALSLVACGAADQASSGSDGGGHAAPGTGGAAAGTGGAVGAGTAGTSVVGSGGQGGSGSGGTIVIGTGGTASDGGVSSDGGGISSDAGSSADAGTSPDARGATGGAAVGGRGGAGGALTATGGRAGAGSGGNGGVAGAGGPVTVFIAGDSTVSNYAANAANMQAGWGQMLGANFNAQVKISNQAIGGRTSRRFIGEGRLTTILNAMKPGDYLMVQFGTNDGNTTAVYADGEPYFVNTTDFQMYMNQYIDGARGKQGIPILVTPPPRASCTGDSHTFGNGLLGYANAMKTVAAAKSAALVDLNLKTWTYLNTIGCVAAKADFFLLNDGTHFQQNGARIMAGFVADGVVALGLPLAAYRLP